jgi:hypothetical protein
MMRNLIWFFNVNSRSVIHIVGLGGDIREIIADKLRCYSALAR